MSFLNLWVGSASRHRYGFRLVLFFLILCPALPVHADWRKEYREGIEAVDGKDWASAVQHMRDAIGEQPESSDSIKIYGLRFEAYMPYYYLGMALYRQGDFKQALEALRRAESQGPGKSELKRLRKMREDCESRLPPLTPPPPPPPPPPKPPPPRLDTSEKALADAIRLTEAAFEGSYQAAQAFRKLRQQNDHDFAWLYERNASLEIRVSQADQATTAAYVAFERAKSQKDADGVKRVSVTAAQIEERWNSLDRDLRKLHQAEQQTLQSELSRLGSRVEQLVEEAQTKVSVFEVKEGRDALALLRREARRSSSGASLREMGALRGRLSSAIADFETVLARASVPIAPPSPLPPPPNEQTIAPPAQLKQAAESFLGGNYRDVLRQLGGASFTSQKARSISHLLHAAAYFGLYEEGGRSQEDLRSSAVSSVRNCRRLGGKIKPSVKFFSPAFIELFNS